MRGWIALLAGVASALPAGGRVVMAAAPPSSRGELLAFELAGSTHLPGGPRDYWVYVPAQYTPDRPACLYVGLDGVPHQAPALFDRLIQGKQMPVTIGVFVGAIDRSLEYDSPGEAYARFLSEDLLPDVERRQASGGRPLRLSRDGNDRAIGGVGSAGFAAFNAAWERPADWSRVWSGMGAYLGLRGADRTAVLVRKREARPLRVFLQAAGPGRARDGAGDGFAGDLLLANQAMAGALGFAGYEVTTRWAPAGRDGPAHAAAVFPQALRWLWRDWPRRVAAGKSRNPLLAELLRPGEDWQLVGAGYRFTEGPAANARGELFFNDIPNARTYKIALDGTVAVHIPDSQKANGQAFGPDGRLYALTGGAGQLVAYDDSRRATVVAQGFPGNDLVVAHNGDIYATSPPDGREPTRESHVWLVRPDGSKRVVDRGLKYANGVALSPDQRVLYVDDHRSRWVYSYRVLPDGGLADKKRFCALHVPETADDSSADGMKVDQQGRVYVATRTGLLQICDRDGRVVAILPTPNRRISNLAFGGKDGDTLFVTAGDRVWRRRLNVRPANPWSPPASSAAPGQGRIAK
jgi:gluconolactonase